MMAEIQDIRDSNEDSQDFYSGDKANNPMLPEDYKDDVEKLRGDAIGNTLYSERWLLKVLITLSKFQQDIWCEELEEQLCTLWDMTFESDVVLLLVKHDFISVAHHILQINSEPRLTEILVGIIGNMTSHEDVRLYLAKSAITEFLLALMSTTDTLTLIQLVRLFNTCAWHINKTIQEMDIQNEEQHTKYDGEMKHWITLLKSHSSVLNQNLSFIFNSSTNDDLLLSSLELLSNLCGITFEGSYFSEFLSTPELLTGLLEALHQLLVDAPNSELTCTWGEKAEKASQLWASVINSFCIHDAGMDVIYSRRQDIMRSICIIVDPLGISENLLPLDSRKLDILDSVCGILETIGNRGYMPPAILPRLLTILPLLSISSKQQALNEKHIGNDIEGKKDGNCCDGVRFRILSYCTTVLNSAEALPFIEAFGVNPNTKIKAVLSSLMSCNDNEMEKVILMIKMHLE